MSWLGGYKTSAPKPTQAEIREAKRKQLEADRLHRAQQRTQHKQQLQAAVKAREEADKALQELLDIDTNIFEEQAHKSIAEEEIEELIAPDIEATMVDFDQQNEEDSATALESLKSVQCPFNKEDIEFWFSQLEDQLVVIGIKKQWTKKIALVRFLPPDIQIQVKSLLKLGQSAAGNDIYFRIKKQLLKLHGPKPEDAYLRAKNRVLSGRPSELGKLLVEDLCPADVKLTGCHCDRIIWGMFREKIPVIIRNHIADMPFNKDTYEAVFDKADQVWDSNRSSEPLNGGQVAAIKATPSNASSTSTQQEVAAVQRKNQRNNKNQNGQNQNNNRNQNQRGQNGQSQSGQNGQNSQGTRPPKPAINDDNLCRIHAKWKENANFCAAPWGCRMKNVYKAPQ